MGLEQDTIVAISTPVGRGGIGVEMATIVSCSMLAMSYFSVAQSVALRTRRRCCVARLYSNSTLPRGFGRRAGHAQER